MSTGAQRRMWQRASPELTSAVRRLIAEHSQNWVERQLGLSPPTVDAIVSGGPLGAIALRNTERKVAETVGPMTRQTVGGEK